MLTFFQATTSFCGGPEELRFSVNSAHNCSISHLSPFAKPLAKSGWFSINFTKISICELFLCGPLKKKRNY